MPAEEDIARQEAGGQPQRARLRGGAELGCAALERLPTREQSRREAERRAVLELRKAGGPVRVLHGRHDDALRRERAHEVRSHVHVASEAMRVHQQRQPARDLRGRCVQLTARGCIGKVRQKEGEPELAEAD